MIWMLDTWLFYLLLSVLLLGITFSVGIVLHRLIQKKEKKTKMIERAAAVILAAVMAALYLYASEWFTDRAAMGERVVTTDGIQETQREQSVVIPFGSYAVVERLYDFGYTRDEERSGETIRYTFTITDAEVFLKEYENYIEGNGVFINRGRIAFEQLYEEEWRPQLPPRSEDSSTAFRGVKVEQSVISP
ncbi:hypothetical protein [Salibacterium qingdaonense]|uniref:Uncharacterized protein n=1 Tax=Salibacterium qingdaonense TaxID=266892 RepID=A0A1I4IGP1_9BACI|nr:hypothetical protein [Salibacterium qingdaonense]SFL53173.1 hypothetical protein SAMN04488054_10224 [Salibacterium qingdaonense]